MQHQARGEGCAQPGAAQPSILPALALGGMDRLREAAGSGWHLLHPGQAAWGRLQGARQRFQLLRAARLPLLLPPFQLISSNPSTIHEVTISPLLAPLARSSPAQPCIPRGRFGRVLPRTSSI